MMKSMNITLFILLLLPLLVSGFGGWKEQFAKKCRVGNSGFGFSRSNKLAGDSRIRDIDMGARQLASSSTALYTSMKFKDFDQVLDAFEEPVLVYFSTKNCGPCKLMKKEVEEVRRMVGEDFKVFSIDTERWPSVGSRCKVARLPCLVVFQQGQILLRFEGVNKAEEVVKQVRTLLSLGC
jgi:thiol-disulfide isomerase/thioredoxin